MTISQADDVPDNGRRRDAARIVQAHRVPAHGEARRLREPVSHNGLEAVADLVVGIEEVLSMVTSVDHELRSVGVGHVLWSVAKNLVRGEQE